MAEGATISCLRSSSSSCRAAGVRRASRARSLIGSHRHAAQTRLVPLRLWRLGNGPLRDEVIVGAAAPGGDAEVPDMTYGLVGRYQPFFRALPLYAGGAGIACLLLNRAVSGVAAVVDASSSQSRADVLGIVLSAVLLLTGLQWLSLKQRVVPAVALDGDSVSFVAPSVPALLQAELAWAWDSVSACARIRSLVLIYDGRTLLHAGLIRRGIRPGTASKPGDICRACMSSGQGNYLANLVLYPGRLEFTTFLPEATQGVVVQPVGSRGVLIAGTDTVRGISRLDQAWIASIADKLEVGLEQALPVPNAPSGVGFGQRTGGSGAESASV